MAEAQTAVSVDPEIIRDFEPFDDLTDDQLLVLASKSSFQTVAKRHCLFEQGSRDPWTICLLEGTVELEAKDGGKKLVQGGTEQARRPLAQLKPRQFTAKALSRVTFIRIDTSSLGNFLDALTQSQYQVEEFAEEDEQIHSDVLWRQHNDLLSNKLTLPSLPAVAIKVSQLIDRDSAPAEVIAKAINADPAIAAKLIRTANSPLYHGRAQVDSCDKAIVRLGLQTTRQLVTSFAMNDLFRSESPVLQKRMTALWQHSTQVAAICYVVARKTETLEPEQALLAGLLHDIGELPLLNYADSNGKLANDPAALEDLLSQHRAQVGAMILKKWNFPKSLVAAATQADYWERTSPDGPDYADLVVVSQLHSFIGTDRMPDIPQMDELPAFRKLAGNGLDPKLSMEILKEAKQDIEEVNSLLRA